MATGPTSSGPKPSPHRDQTDESLRTERNETDRALRERQVVLQDDADQVIQHARETADAVLTAARDRADLDRDPTSTVAERRDSEDDVLRDERATADATLQRERQETARALARLLPLERGKTDRYLLTERARSDTEIAQRDDFLGMVSHDLRNLLGGIALNVSILSEKADDSSNGREVKSRAAQIERYAALMNRLIGDLVDVASIDSGVLAMARSPGDAGQVVAEAVEAFRAAAAAKQITFTVEVAPVALLADFDHERLLQVFANLLSNAIKFTAPHHAITIGAARDKDQLHFTVQDTGVGVPAGMLELIFQRFWQVSKNDRRGTGLGLYISRCIVEAHEGTIWAESSVGSGTTVHFTIPTRGAA